MKIEDFPVTTIKWPEGDEVDVILEEHIEQYMPPIKKQEFDHWMSGQTVLVVNGRAGYYTGDVKIFLKNKGVID